MTRKNNEKIKRVLRNLFFILSIWTIAPSVNGQPPRAVSQPLLPGRVLEKALSAKEAHRYEFNLRKDEFFQVIVTQKGIDVALKLLDTESKVLARMDSPNGNEETEILSFVAPQSGKYFLEVTSFDDEQEKGNYSIKRGLSRMALPRDRRRVEVERIFGEGMEARNPESPEHAKALPKLKEALRGWQELKDSYLIALTTDQIDLLNAEPQFFPMPINSSVEGEVVTGAVHWYILKGGIRKGQVLRLDAEEKGANIRLQLLASNNPQDAGLVASRNFGEGFGRETITFIAENDTKNCVLAVRSLLTVTSKKSGAYKLSVKFSESAGDADRTRLKAELLLETAFDKRALPGTQSTELLNEARENWETLGDKYWAGYAANEMGVNLLHANAYPEASQYFIIASGSFDDIKDEWARAETTSNLAEVAAGLGDNGWALFLDKDALERLEKLDDVYAQARVNNNIGRIMINFDSPERALPFLQKALKQSRDKNNKNFEQVSLINIGMSYLLLKKFKEAETASRQAIDLAPSVNDDNALSIAKHNLSEALVQQGNIAGAQALLLDSLLLQRKTGNKLAEARTLYQLSTVLAATKPRTSVLYGKMAVNLFQFLRSSLGDINNETRKEFLRSVRSAYDRLAMNLLRQDRLLEAHQVLNRIKDQQAFDLASDPEKNPAFIAFTRSETSYFRDYEARGMKITEALEQEESQTPPQNRKDAPPEAGPDPTKAEQELETATKHFFSIFGQIETEFENTAASDKKIESTEDIRELQAVLKDLKTRDNQDTIAVYVLLTDGYYDSIIVSSNDIKAVSRPISGVELSKKVYQLWGVLQSDKYDVRPLSQQVYQTLIEPLRTAIPPGTTTIMWSQDRILSYIPMAALYDGKKFLAERYNNIVFTRVNLERLTRSVSKKWTGSGFGTSKQHIVGGSDDAEKITFYALPGVVRELDAIFGAEGKNGILKGDFLINQKFTRDAFYKTVKLHRPLVHISSHFWFEPGNEYGSFLLLGDGTTLSLQEIKEQSNIFDGVELLTLSACNTAATQSGGGREVDAFAELAQRLGAGAVLASLWSVSDASTAQLMQDFYGLRESEGLTKSEALRRAQLGLLNGTAKVSSIAGFQKGSPLSNVKLIVTPDGKPRGKTNRKPGDNTRGAKIYISARNAPLFRRDPNKLFAHPYYWSAFVLYGNGR